MRATPRDRPLLNPGLSDGCQARKTAISRWWSYTLQDHLFFHRPAAKRFESNLAKLLSLVYTHAHVSDCGKEKTFRERSKGSHQVVPSTTVL